MNNIEISLWISGLTALSIFCYWFMTKEEKMTTPILPNGTLVYFFEGDEMIHGFVVGFKKSFYTVHVTHILGREHNIDVNVHYEKIKRV